MFACARTSGDASARTTSGDASDRTTNGDASDRTGDVSARTGDSNHNHNKDLVEAIRNQDFEEVKNLLEHHLDNIDINGYIYHDYSMKTLLCLACEAAATTDTRIVSLLLKYGADPNHDVVEMNGKRYYSRSNGNPPLIFFATDDVLALLLQYGADLNVLHRESGWAPLHYRCRNADYHNIDLLLRHGADPNQRDRDGESPVFHISRFKDNFDDNHLSCLRLLLEYGANPNVIKSDWGTTPLFLFIPKARGECRLDVIRLMMQHGADVTMPLRKETPWCLDCANCIKGDTVLHAAVRLCDVDTVRVITESQATKKFWWLQNDHGDTVYDLAAKWKVAPIIEYLDGRLRQECYSHLLYDWIPRKPRMKTMTMIHHINDNAARSDIDAAMPFEVAWDGIFATASLRTKSQAFTDRKDARDTFQAWRNCDITSQTASSSQQDSIDQDATPSKQRRQRRIRNQRRMMGIRNNDDCRPLLRCSRQ